MLEFSKIVITLSSYLQLIRWPTISRNYNIVVNYAVLNITCIAPCIMLLVWIRLCSILIIDSFLLQYFISEKFSCLNNLFPCSVSQKFVVNGICSYQSNSWFCMYSVSICIYFDIYCFFLNNTLITASRKWLNLPHRSWNHHEFAHLR